MSQESDRQLTERIRMLTRLDLDFPNTQVAAPDVRALIQHMSFVKIRRLSRFWVPQDRTDKVSLEHSIESCITGLYGQRTPWMFVILGEPQKIECWFGASRNKFYADSLIFLVSGAFPDIRLSSSDVLNTALFSQCQHRLCFTGIPNVIPPQASPQRVSEHLEKICRGLYGAFWGYIVYAYPVEPTATINDLYQLTSEIRRAQTSYLLKNSPTGEQDRLAQRYIKLLEAQLARFEQGRSSGMWHTQITLIAEHAALAGRAQALLQSAFSGEYSTPEPVRVIQANAGIAKDSKGMLSTTLTSREVSLLACLPREAYPGYDVVDYARFGVSAAHHAPSESSATLGKIFDRGQDTRNPFTLPLRDFSKHALIVGVTGSGKTNTCFAILDQLWKHKIPFLVIESAKSEYRALLKDLTFNGLNVFTVGDETISPLRLNPFEVPEGVLVQTHIDYLKSLFSAAFVLYPPMPYVLEQSLHEVYEDRGWNLATNTNRRGKQSVRRFPTLADLAAKVETVIQRLRYDEQISMNIRAGLLARLNMLRLGGGKGLMFNTRCSIENEILFNRPCILELQQLVSDDEKAFLIGLILIRLYEYCAGQAEKQGTIRHITLIEEAHRLLRNVSTEQGSDVVANPKGRAIEVFANILSEIRAYGEGMLIAEQIPTKLTPDAIKNTNLKIVHRLVAEDDRKAVGSTMNLSDMQIRYMTTLCQGEGIAYTEGMTIPVLVQVPCKKSNDNVSAQIVKDHMNDFSEARLKLFMNVEGCKECPFGWTKCAYRGLGTIEQNPLLQEAFLRLFNSLRCRTAYVLDAYEEFCAYYDHLPSSDSLAPSPYCVLAEWFDDEIERRGVFGGWAYKYVEQLIAGSCSVLSTITQHFGKIASEQVSTMVSSELAVLSKLFQQRYIVERRPYAGCASCLEPCVYRYDMASQNQSMYAEDFREAISQQEPELKKLVETCQKAAARSFYGNDTRSQQGAALCFAVQQLSLRQLSRNRQKELSAGLLMQFQEGGYDG